MNSPLEHYDRELLLKINSWHNDSLDWLMWQYSEIYIFLPIAFILIFFYYKRYQLKNTAALLLCCCISVALTDISSNTVKHAVKRYRPTHNLEIKDKLHYLKDNDGKDYHGGKYGFFSSHAANTVGVTTLLFLAASWIPKRRRFLFYLIPFMIIYSRIYIGAHYPSDVILGSIDGIIFGYITFIIFRRYFFKSPLMQDA
ncbi:MAG: phosphatase PAP2 family protein [Bacteroidetes bacterium]|nr:phosphatase PAP2 family protein [Bacteroidota bacterium]